MSVCAAWVLLNWWVAGRQETPIILCRRPPLHPLYRIVRSSQMCRIISQIFIRFNLLSDMAPPGCLGACQKVMRFSLYVFPRSEGGTPEPQEPLSPRPLSRRAPAWGVGVQAAAVFGGGLLMGIQPDILVLVGAKRWKSECVPNTPYQIFHLPSPVITSFTNWYDAFHISISFQILECLC